MNFQMFKLVLEKAEEPEIKFLTSDGSLTKQESSRKTSISALLTLPKPLTVQFSSAAQSCPTLCNPMYRSMAALPVHHQLPEFTQTHVHRDSDAFQPSHPVIPFSSFPQSLPASQSFAMSQLFAWGGQSTGVSALASVLPKKPQGWSPSELIGWKSWITINWQIVKEMGIPDHLTYLLRILYASQEATVRTGHETTDQFQIGKGVCQGCILSSLLI